MLLVLLTVVPACGSDITTLSEEGVQAQASRDGKGGGGADEIAPSVPENLAATLEDDHVLLSWSKSADDRPGKVKYEVFRDASYLAEAASNEYADLDVIGGETYSYQVRALDKAGNQSLLSPEVSITLPGDPTSPPPAPSCELTAFPEIITVGGSSTLTLTGSGSYTAVTLHSVPVTLVDGLYEEDVSPDVSTEYVAVIEGEGGSSSCAVTVMIGEPPPPPPPSGSCLATALTLETATIAKYRYYFDTVAHAVDASGVVWMGDGTESTVVETRGSMQSCFSGGLSGGIVDGGIPLDAVYECTPTHCPDGKCPQSCYAYHSAAGIGPDVSDLQIFEDLLIRKTGDGISLATDASRDVIARRIHMYEIHDDAFESDFGAAGFLIENSLVESANSGFAMRLRSSAGSVDQTDQVWNIRNNLVRLLEFPNTYKERPGHGNLYKLQGDDNEPIFKIVGNTFVLGPVLSGEDIMPPVSRTHECSDNTILWTGTQAQWDSYQNDGYHPDGGYVGQRLAALNGTFGSTCMDVRIKPDGLSVDEFLSQEGWYALVQQWKSTYAAG